MTSWAARMAEQMKGEARRSAIADAPVIVIRLDGADALDLMAFARTCGATPEEIGASLIRGVLADDRAAHGVRP